VKLGTHIKLPDGRTGTVVYNSLVGVGIKWGLHNPNPDDFIGTDGNTVTDGMPDGFEWEPDALLRDPWPRCEQYGFRSDECIGDEYSVIDGGLNVI